MNYLDPLFRRITDYRLISFLAILGASVYLARMGDLESADLKLILIADIAAFIGAQAWENVKGVPPETKE